MKSLFIAALVLVGIAAQAEVKPQGTLVQTKCARTVTSNSGVKGVCFASKVGMKGQYLQLTGTTSGQPTSILLPIVDVQPGNSGITGGFRSVIVSVLVEGDILLPLHGTGTPSDIKSLRGDIFGRYDFQASNFQFVMQTESVGSGR